MKLKRINLFFGFILFSGFLVTGYYMKEYFKPEHLNNHMMRMQIRANHIYILFISLINVLSYKIDLSTNHKLSKFLNILFRVLILIAGIVAVVAFFQEHTGNMAERSWTLSAVILSVISVGIVIINEIIYSLTKKKSI